MTLFLKTGFRQFLLLESLIEIILSQQTFENVLLICIWFGALVQHVLSSNVHCFLFVLVHPDAVLSSSKWLWIFGTTNVGFYVDVQLWTSLLRKTKKLAKWRFGLTLRLVEVWGAASCLSVLNEIHIFFLVWLMPSNWHNSFSQAIT